MKKRKISWLLNIATICLCVCAIAIGVYSAKTASLSISGTIGFTANNCDVFVYATLTGAAKKGTNDEFVSAETIEFGTEDNYINIHNNKDSWNIGEIYFDDMNDVPDGKDANDIVLTIKMYNDSKFEVLVQINTSLLGDNTQVEMKESEPNIYLPKNQTKDNATTLTISLSLKTDTDFTENISLDTKNLVTITKATNTSLYNYTDFTFDTTANDGTATLTEYNGTDANVIIPSIYVDGDNMYSVTAIDDSVFEDNEDIKHVAIPSSVTSIGDSAFSCCTSLESITIPSSVASIDSSAFRETAITSITIPSSVTTIGVQSIVFGCNSLEEIIVESGNTMYDSRNDCNAIIETSTNKLIVGCKNTEIPTGVVIIGKFAFVHHYGLKNITIPSSVTTIESNAFAYCIGLTSIIIPSSVTNIESSAFSGAHRLVEIINKSSLNIAVGGAVNNIGFFAKQVITDETQSKLSTDGNDFIIYDDTILVAYQGTKTNITIPSNITEINQYTFEKCSNLVGVTIPSSVTSIGSHAFDTCTNLTSITFQGTQEQWNAITKGSGWNYKTGSYTIHCTDGDIEKS